MRRVLLRACVGLLYLVPHFPLGAIMDSLAQSPQNTRFSVRQLCDLFIAQHSIADRAALESMTNMTLIILVAYFTELEFGHSMIGVISDLMTEHHFSALVVWFREALWNRQEVRSNVMISREHSLETLDDLLASMPDHLPVHVPTMDGRENMWMEPACVRSNMIRNRERRSFKGGGTGDTGTNRAQLSRSSSVEDMNGYTNERWPMSFTGTNTMHDTSSLSGNVRRCSVFGDLIAIGTGELELETTGSDDTDSTDDSGT
jgi:hypothetical protein